ncbi:two-component system sensor histidine kinase NtrB [Actinoplanes palleronii]|nr:ATP-binding protein [Actinoplanes palleronii]
MLGQVRTLFLALCLIWTLVGLGWADLNRQGGPYVTLGAVTAVLVPLIVGYRRGGFPRWTWFVEGVGVCLIATNSGHSITFGLLFVWVNFRALYGSLTDHLIGGGTILGILVAGVAFLDIPASDALSMLVAALLGLIVNHVLARGIQGRDRAAIRERAVAKAGAEFAATNSRTEATAVAVKAALTMDPDTRATLIAIVAGGNARIIGADGEVRPEVVGSVAPVDQLGDEVRAALVPGGFALVSGEAATHLARVFELPPVAAVAVAPLAVHDDVFGMIVLLLTRRPPDDLEAALTTLADAAAMTLDQQLSRSRLKIVVEHSPDALILASERGVIRFVNPAAERLLDRPAAELLGSNLRLLLNPDDLATTLAARSAVAQTCRVRGREDQAWTETEAVVEYVTEHDGSRSIVFNARDVSERRRLEMELQHAQKLQSVGRLAAGIAHEINTPIQFIGDNVHFIEEAFSGFATVLDAYEKNLRHGGPATAIESAIEEADFEYLWAETPIAIRQCLEGITQVAHIVRAMKAFGHPGSDEKKCANLNEAIQNTIIVAANEIKFVADVTTDLADLPMVPCQVGDINQTMLNLIINAAHAIEAADRGRGTIHITTQVQHDHAVIEVADTGTGVPAEIADKLFDPFFTTKDVGAGTGQGLALVRTLVVDRHGGEVDFTSEPGAGTTFRVRLPLQDPAASHHDENIVEAAA